MIAIEAIVHKLEVVMTFIFFSVWVPFAER